MHLLMARGMITLNAIQVPPFQIARDICTPESNVFSPKVGGTCIIRFDSWCKHLCTSVSNIEQKRACTAAWEQQAPKISPCKIPSQNCFGAPEVHIICRFASRNNTRARSITENNTRGMYNVTYTNTQGRKFHARNIPHPHNKNRRSASLFQPPY